MEMLTLLLIAICVCFAIVLAGNYKTDRVSTIAAGVGLLLTLILIFNPA